MTAKRLIIHVGYHKTGSSSVQQWLLQHAEVLSPHLHCYNLADGGSNPLKLAVMNWLRGNSTETELAAHCRAMADEIAALPQPVVCITDESLLGMPLGFSNGDYVETQIYPNTRRVIDVLAREFSDFDLTIIAVERDAEKWLRSVHNQMHKQKCLSEDFEGYQDRFDPNVDWADLRSEIETGLDGRGDLEVLNFEEEFSRSSVSEMAFFQIFDLPESLLEQCHPTLEHVNPSIPLRHRPVMESPKAILVLGGSNSLILNGWVNLMRRDYGALVSVSNLSMGAFTTTMGIYRLLSHTARSQRTPVIWEYGVNEFNHLKGGQSLSSLLLHVEWLLQICIREERPFVPVLMQTKTQSSGLDDGAYVKAMTALFQSYGVPVLNCMDILMAMTRGQIDLDAWYSDDAHYDVTTNLPRRITEAVIVAVQSAPVPVTPQNRSGYFDPLDICLAFPADPVGRLDNSIMDIEFTPFENTPEIDVPGRALAAIIATSGSGPDIRFCEGDTTLGCYATQVAHGPQIPARQLRQLVLGDNQGGLAVDGTKLQVYVEDGAVRPIVQTMFRKGPKPETHHENGLVAILCESPRT